MAPRFILLVTGSRSLCATPASEQWARAAISERIDAMGSRDVLLTGGAIGPDTYARLIAEERGVPWVSYLASGVRLASDDAPQRCEPPQRWINDDVRRPTPLFRNQCMLLAVATSVQLGWRAAVLGLVDRGSKTHGTDYTVRLAKKSRLPTERLVWP